MSRFSDFFRNLFRHSEPTPAPAAQPVPGSPGGRPVDPVPVPATPIAPEPVPAVLQPIPNPAPWGYTIKPDGTRVRNAGPNAGWGWDYDGGPIQSQKAYDRWKNLTDTTAATQAAVCTGPVAYTDAPDADLAFLINAQRNYKLPGGLFYAIYNGPKPEVDKLINRADLIWKSGYDPATYPANGRMRGLIDDFANGRIKTYYG